MTTSSKFIRCQAIVQIASIASTIAAVAVLGAPSTAFGAEQRVQMWSRVLNSDQFEVMQPDNRQLDKIKGVRQTSRASGYRPQFYFGTTGVTGKPGNGAATALKTRPDILHELGHAGN